MSKGVASARATKSDLKDEVRPVLRISEVSVKTLVFGVTRHNRRASGRQIDFDQTFDIVTTYAVT